MKMKKAFRLLDEQDTLNNGSNIFLCKRFVFSKLLYLTYFNLYFSYTTGLPQISINP